MEAPVDYTPIKTQSRSSLGYEPSFGTSLAKVGGLVAENNCRTHIQRHYVNLRIDTETINKKINAEYISSRLE